MFRLILLLALTLPAFAGGSLLLSIGNPAATDDPAAQGALVTARVTSCFGTTVSQVHWTVKAVGIVDGQRVSQPVRTVPLTKDGLVAIHWTRPQQGDWQLQFTSSGRTLGIDIGAAPLRPQTRDMTGR